jgi:uncharacterized protein (TIGR02145 family)
MKGVFMIMTLLATLTAFSCGNSSNPSGGNATAPDTPNTDSGNPNTGGKDTIPAAESDTLLDTRDGKVYKTVKIGNQRWMAENLNFKITDTYTEKSWCYDNAEFNCDKYGRLYTWEAALIACPAGWQLPTYDEWETLSKYAGGAREAGAKLRAAEPEWDGTDEYGFTALPAGERFNNAFNGVGLIARWWTSRTTGGDGIFADGRGTCSANSKICDGYLSYGGWRRIEGHSVRCIKK